MRDASNFSRWVTVCWRVAQGDGDCSVSEDASFNKALLQDGQPGDFQVVHASMPVIACFHQEMAGPCVLYQLGASWGPALARGQIWRLVTPVMLHANLTHLLFNVFFQLRMGFGMKRQFGREKMMMIYFACGLFGNLMSVAVDPYKLAVGASTAGFGLIGVWLAEILLSWEILGPALTTMSSMTPNMDIFGHLGGALGGFLLALVISDMKETDRPEWYHQVRAAAALALLLCLSGGLIKAFEINPKDPIPDCQIFKSLSHVMDAAAKTMSAHVTAVQFNVYGRCGPSVCLVCSAASSHGELHSKRTGYLYINGAFVLLHIECSCSVEQPGEECAMKKAEDALMCLKVSRESKASARPTSARVSASTETLAQTSPARGRSANPASCQASAPSTQPTPNSPPRKKQEDKEASSPPTVQPQVNLASVGPGAPLFAPPPGLERQSEEILAPPGLGPPPGLGGPMLGFSDLFASIRRRDFAEAYGGFETDTTSFDEEVELLRCEKDLVEAAVELGTTTSAEDDLLTTDADVDDEEDGLVSIAKLGSSDTTEDTGNLSLCSKPAAPLDHNVCCPSSDGILRFRPLLHRPSVANAVIEEEDEEDASENDPVPGSFEADSTQVRSRLWAQSLLRLRRSIDEIYLLCEFESDEGLTEQVQKILKQAGQDFGSLLKQLDNQQVGIN
eukprot:g1835.t1